MVCEDNCYPSQAMERPRASSRNANSDDDEALPVDGERQSRASE